MPSPKISVVIPTLPERSDLLEQCVRDYEELTPNAEIIVVPGKPSCGEAWQEGSERATGDYLHLTADDIEPLPGWWEAGIRAVDSYFIPAANVWRPNGSLESAVAWETPARHHGQPAALSQIPFCSMQWWHDFIGPMVPIQYYSDNWFMARAADWDIPCLWAEGYEFVHHRPPNLRPGESEQTMRDRVRFERYRRQGYTWEDVGL